MAFFQEFPVLENAIIKFQDFPGFPGPLRTLWPFIYVRRGRLLQGQYASWLTLLILVHVYRGSLQEQCTRCDIDKWGHFVPVSWRTNSTSWIFRHMLAGKKINFFAKKGISHEENSLRNMSHLMTLLYIPALWPHLMSLLCVLALCPTPCPTYISALRPCFLSLVYAPTLCPHNMSVIVGWP